MSTGALSAIERNRSSLSRSALVRARRSATSAARNMSGVEATARNNCNASTLASALAMTKGPRPWTTPEIDRSATIRSAALTPGGPKRTAAQSRSGKGRYTSVGTLPSVAGGRRKTPTLTASSPPAIRQASTTRAPDGLPETARTAPMDVRSAGATVRKASPSDRNQTRQ
jgi:hypothetical protein